MISTAALVELTDGRVVSPQATLALYSSLHNIVLALLKPNAPATSQVIDYLAESLIPALDNVTPVLSATSLVVAVEEANLISRRELLEDGLFDIIWQLDQEVENGLVTFVATGAPVSSSSAPEQTETASASQDKPQDKRFEEARKTGRTALVALLKGLNVRTIRGRQANRQNEDSSRGTGLPQAKNVLSTAACLERCPGTLLYQAQILTDTPMIFERREVRARTAMLYVLGAVVPFSPVSAAAGIGLTPLRTSYRYKQQKFNLLREESEGYAKLAVELISNMGPPHSASDGSSQERVGVRMQRARSMGDSLKSLIGNSSFSSSKVRGALG